MEFAQNLQIGEHAKPTHLPGRRPLPLELTAEGNLALSAHRGK
jgi:hypothetical protein